MMSKIFGAAALALALLAGSAAEAQNTKNYVDQGGSKTHVAGTLSIESGGTLDLKAGAILTASGKAAVTANAGNSYAVTANQSAIVVTTDALTTAAASAQTITISDSLVTTSSIVLIGRNGGTSTAGTPSIKAVPTAGTITITIDNKHASAAFNGTFVISVVTL